MDDRGRLAQSLNPAARQHGAVAAKRRADRRRQLLRPGTALSHGRVMQPLQQMSCAILNSRPPRWAATMLAATVMFAGLVYGAIKGDHVGDLLAGLKGARDQLASTAGFRIAAIALSGQQHVGREEIFATAGVAATSSLLFLDVEAARDRLKTNPWIADATLLKLYPDQLQIGIKERVPFALWQKEGRVYLIAADGIVLEPYANSFEPRLPLVVGRGAEVRAREFLALLARHPALGDQVAASILVGERRWNLRLKNGLDVKLPETDLEQALLNLIGLDRDKQLLSRDVVSIDLRLPDRVTVRLSEAAAQARAESLKDKKPKKKGGDA
jgi:cell division protein FtsQ